MNTKAVDGIIKSAGINVVSVRREFFGKKPLCTACGVALSVRTTFRSVTEISFKSTDFRQRYKTGRDQHYKRFLSAGEQYE